MPIEWMPIGHLRLTAGAWPISHTGLAKVQYNFNGSVTTSTCTFRDDWIDPVRSGGDFSAYLSPGGLTWTAFVTNRSLPTTTTATKVGLFECPHKAGTLGTATFDEARFMPRP